jgi:hypothetical protein
MSFRRGKKKPLEELSEGYRTTGSVYSFDGGCELVWRMTV